MRNETILILYRVNITHDKWKIQNIKYHSKRYIYYSDIKDHRLFVKNVIQQFILVSSYFMIYFKKAVLSVNYQSDSP